MCGRAIESLLRPLAILRCRLRAVLDVSVGISNERRRQHRRLIAVACSGRDHHDDHTGHTGDHSWRRWRAHHTLELLVSDSAISFAPRFILVCHLGCRRIAVKIPVSSRRHSHQREWGPVVVCYSNALGRIPIVRGTCIHLGFAAAATAATVGAVDVLGAELALAVGHRQLAHLRCRD